MNISALTLKAEHRKQSKCHNLFTELPAHRENTHLNSDIYTYLGLIVGFIDQVF
jgi:hypothetical protein